MTPGSSKRAAAVLAGLLDRAGDTRTVMRQLVNAVAETRGLTPPWVAPPATGLEPLGDLDGWGVVELGEMRAGLLSTRDREARGVVYTPPEIVDFQVRSALRQARLDRVAGERRPLEHIHIHDPFCGPGIFLVAAARYVARWYNPADPQAVLPEVMAECIYGTDLDEVAIDVAKSVCWLEIRGVRSIDFMDDNVIVGDTFNNDLPPKLEKRWPLAERPAYATRGVT